MCQLVHTYLFMCHLRERRHCYTSGHGINAKNEKEKGRNGRTKRRIINILHDMETTLPVDRIAFLDLLVALCDASPLGGTRWTTYTEPVDELVEYSELQFTKQYHNWNVIIPSQPQGV